MLDPDDEQVIKDAKDGGAVLVTWDRVMRLAAGGITPYEAMDQAMAAPTGTPEARAEVSRLRRLTPSQLCVMAEGANTTWELGERSPDDVPRYGVHPGVVTRLRAWSSARRRRNCLVRISSGRRGTRTAWPNICPRTTPRGVNMGTPEDITAEKHFTPPDKEIRRNGYIATLRKAKKEHQCSACGFPIEPTGQYYEVVAGGGGLGWLKFPDRCHAGCLNQYLEREEG